LKEAEEITKQKLPDGFDARNKIPTWNDGSWCGKNYINCQALMRLLGAEKTEACDISDYEGAEHIFDLGLPLPKQYKNRFDTILDVGTLEHIFDIPQALENINDMLKAGGTLVMASPMSKAANHGFYSISPTLYHDYLIENGYADIRLYVLGHDGNIGGTARAYEVMPEAIAEPFPASFELDEVMLFAKKGTETTHKRAIVQTVYKQLHAKKDVFRYSRLTQTIRPLVQQYRHLIPGFLYGIYGKLHFKKSLKYMGRF